MKLLFAIALHALKTIFLGFIVSMIWNWFIAFKFNCIKLDVITGVGISLFIDALFINTQIMNKLEKLENDAKKDEFNEYDSMNWNIIKTSTLLTIVYPSLLFIAWVWHMFIR